jgi:hypothetical protein
VVGTNGAVLATRDGGASWKPQVRPVAVSAGDLFLEHLGAAGCFQPGLTISKLRGRSCCSDQRTRDLGYIGDRVDATGRRKVPLRKSRVYSR